MSVCAGYLQGRSQRDRIRGLVAGRMGCYPTARLSWGSVGGSGAAFPTVEDVLCCNGESRGGEGMLYRAVHAGLAKYVGFDGIMRTVCSEEAAYIVDGVLYFYMPEIQLGYERRGYEGVFVGAPGWFRDSEEYHEKVIGTQPHPLCPDPASAL